MVQGEKIKGDMQMTTLENQPEWMTLADQMFGVTENFELTYSFSINSKGDCTVWLQKLNNKNIMYKTRCKYFKGVDEACDWVKDNAKQFCKHMENQLQSKQRYVDSKEI